jgi:hypothetical protein
MGISEINQVACFKVHWVQIGRIEESVDVVVVVVRNRTFIDVDDFE